MSPDLPTLLAYRNARLRAWAALGVPVEGGWSLTGHIGQLIVHCDAEDPCVDPALEVLIPRKGISIETSIRAAELRGVGFMVGRGCSHLVPLLRDEDTPEVKEVLALELLAGPGG